MNVKKLRTVVIEGPDGAGKSTLAAALVSAYGLELVHTGGPLKDRQDFLDREKNLNLLDPSARIIDRVPYISDQVYAFLNSRDPIVTPDDENRFMQKSNALVVYCRLSSSAEMVERISLEKKAHKPPEYMEKVKLSHPALVASYDKILHDLGLRNPGRVFQYNWMKDSQSSLREFLESRFYQANS